MIGTLLLNRYELLEVIGEGGMGIVYKARCHLLNRLVAVKILKAELSNDADFVARFKREATSAASLSHPNIVNVYDVGTENQINFIVMEYIDGQTLKQVIKATGRLSTERTLDISLQIARALECAHKNNIIHRDIKSDNILITENNIAKVTDFGIAKVANSSTITSVNKIMGSAHYFSPEQAKGLAVDFRTDIYSLGIVMYEMITGQVPYNADSSIAVAMMHIQGVIISPKEVISDLPENINQAILKALDKDADKRYQTVREMADILSVIKQDFEFKISLDNRSNCATEVMSKVVSNLTSNDFTKVMSKPAGTKKTITKKDRLILSENKGPSKNSKILIIIGLIILVMIIGVLGKYLSRSPSAIVKAAIPKASEKLPVIEKQLVPSLIGSTQDIANQAIINNGFLIGNTSNDYSDSIANGLVISQSPKANESYEKEGKIDIVISQGQKIVQVTVPELTGKTIDEAQGILDGLQLKLGATTKVIVNDKRSKGNHSKDIIQGIYSQDKEAGTFVDIGTEINVTYYQNKRD